MTVVGSISIPRSRIVLLFVGCCSVVTLTMLRLQFLFHQSMLLLDFDEKEHRRHEPLSWITNGFSGDHDENNKSGRNAAEQSKAQRFHWQNNVARKKSIHAEQHNVQAPPLSPKGKKRKQAVINEPSANATDHSTAMGKNVSLHHPNYFTDKCPFQSLLARDNMLSVFTGCSIAAWTYTGVPFPKSKVRFYDDCKCHHDEHNLTQASRSISSIHDDASIRRSLQSGDTLYVEFQKISHFVQYTLDKIHVDVILISGQNHLVPQKPKPLDDVWSNHDFDAICQHKHITHWFLMNMDVYAQNPNHAKLHPFPYGLGSTLGNSKYTPDTAKVGTNPMHAFRKELHNNNDDVEGTDIVDDKNTSIFVGYFTMRTNRAQRKLVPRGEKLPPTLQFRKMKQSLYVLSPNGDRPDCYRHYEAIGLGAMPITQMHPKYYRHLEGQVIFNNTNWNLTELQATLPKRPTVNRKLIFEEYWMEYVERIVGKPLRWWDPSRNIRCSLSDIENVVKATVLETS